MESSELNNDHKAGIIVCRRFSKFLTKEIQRNSNSGRIGIGIGIGFIFDIRLPWRQFSVLEGPGMNQEGPSGREEESAQALTHIF